jgi:hypothetical protein
MYGFKEKTFNWRFNPSQGEIDYSSRISLYRNNNFSSGIIIEYVLNINQEPSTFASDMYNNSYPPDVFSGISYSLLYLNYNF